LKIVDGTVSPQAIRRKALYRLWQRGNGGRDGMRWSGDAPGALTFQPSNHSFIQAFELQRFPLGP
jgi:hypothetical protein